MPTPDTDWAALVEIKLAKHDELIRQAMDETIHQRFDKYERLLELLLEREESRKKLRTAIIEKGLVALLGSAGVTLLMFLKEGFTAWISRK